MSTKNLLFFFLLLGLATFFFVDPWLDSGPYYTGYKLITFLISPGLNACFWPLLFLVTMRGKYGPFICRINLCVGFGYILAKLVKFLIGRPRPFIEEISWNPLSLTNGYHSLPSGHAVICMAICACFAARFPRKKALFISLGALTPCVRFLAHKHYLSDVFFGEAIALLMLLIFVEKRVDVIYHWFLKLFGVKDDRKTPAR